MLPEVDPVLVRRTAVALAAALCLPLLPAAGAAAAPAVASGPGDLDRACPRGRVALTFDDGPSAYRPQTLQTLRRLRAPATFFEVGLRVAANPQLTLFEAREGYLVLNHTYYHPDLTTLKAWQVRREVQRTEQVIRSAGVALPFKAVRPPFLHTDARTLDVLSGIGYDTVINADVVTDDSNAATTPAQVTATVFAGLAPGRIVLLHDGNIDTPAGQSVTTALRGIVQGIRDRGYCLGTLSRTGQVVAASPVRSSGRPIPRIIRPVPYLPLQPGLRGNPPQDPPRPYVIVRSPYPAPAAASA